MQLFCDDFSYSEKIQKLCKAVYLRHRKCILLVPQIADDGTVYFHKLFSVVLIGSDHQDDGNFYIVLPQYPVSAYQDGKHGSFRIHLQRVWNGESVEKAGGRNPLPLHNGVGEPFRRQTKSLYFITQKTDCLLLCADCVVDKEQLVMKAVQQ